jgi:hypothetical protein
MSLPDAVSDLSEPQELAAKTPLFEFEKWREQLLGSGQIPPGLSDGIFGKGPQSSLLAGDTPVSLLAHDTPVSDLGEAQALAAGTQYFTLAEWREQISGSGLVIAPELRDRVIGEYVRLAKLDHRKGTLAVRLREARIAKQAMAQRAALQRAALTIRHRLTALRSLRPSLPRARRHRPARRSALRTCRPAGRKKRPRGRSSDDPGGLGRRSGAGGVA